MARRYTIERASGREIVSEDYKIRRLRLWPHLHSIKLDSIGDLFKLSKSIGSDIIVRTDGRLLIYDEYIE